MCAVLGVLTVLSGCGTERGLLSSDDDRVQVITTTGILRDLVRNVGGDRVNVVSLVPDRADPHTYEPTLRDVRNVVYADAAFSNYMLLEEHGIIRALDANLRDDAVNVSLAEEAVKYAAEIIPLVENVNLDTVWLGLRAHGTGARYDADRSSEVLLSLTAATGPGDVIGYLTGTFGDVDVYFDSRDGAASEIGEGRDTVTLPADAHTHMSWVFTEPGVYRLTFAAAIRTDTTADPVPVGGPTTFTFAVGVRPTDATVTDPVVVDRGHADIAVDLDADRLVVLYDPTGGGERTQTAVPASRAVIDVPAKALDRVPSHPGYRVIGRPGTTIHQLPQAVLGKHVHGAIDPHLWQDVGNAMAYVRLIRDTLIERDPEGAAAYRANADRYLAELDALDREITRTVAEIPPENRYLVTTHDAFGYLANAYGIRIAGFVTPNPATEPSLADRRKLTETIRTLRVPAVFLEPNLAARSSTLTEIAKEEGVEVCPIHGDAFSEDVTTYVEMMRANAGSLRRCLG